MRQTSLVESTINEIEKLMSHNRAVPFVLFSGGKDSLISLDLVSRASERLQRKPIAIHADTTVSLPCNIEYVKNICDQLKVELVIVRPRASYFELAERWGLPRFRARWCCHALKIGPVNEHLMQQQGDKIIFDGIRAEESKARSEIDFLGYDKKLGCTLCHPVVSWTSTDVKMYLEKRGLPVNPAYAKGFRRASECWCGVFKDPGEFELLFVHYPALFDRLLELESKQKSGFGYIYSHGKGIFLRDMKEEILNKCKAESTGKRG